ncbi:MAG: hypothetical protein ACYC2K_14565 [Gemmatimonadales bacterium]
MRRPRFFLLINLVMLGTVLLAFAPSFFLRSYFPQPPILDMPQLPWLFIVHGAILTLWYGFMVLQAFWIYRGRLVRHRQVGWFGAVLAAATLISTVAIVYRFPERMQAMSTVLGQPVSELEPGLVEILWLDVFMCLFFIATAGGGILLRRRPQVHKRLMVYAGIAFLFAAVFRLGGIVDSSTAGGLGMLASRLLLLGLVVSVPIYDRRVLGRVMPVSWCCVAGYLAAFFGSVAVAQSSLANWVLTWGAR